MSAPVRQSAAAIRLDQFEVVKCGLSLRDREQQHHDARRYYIEKQFFGGEEIIFDNEEDCLRYLQYQDELIKRQQQQQQMEQQPEMVSPSTSIVASNNNTITALNSNNNMASANIPINSSANCCSAPLDVESASGSSSSRYNDDEMMMSTTPPMDAGSTMMEAEVEDDQVVTVTATEVRAAADNGSSSGNDNDEWMLPEDDEGRLGTPGAAVNSYDVQHEQQQQHHTSGPSLMENEKQLNGKKSTSSSPPQPSSSSSSSSDSQQSDSSSSSTNNLSSGASSSSSKAPKTSSYPLSNVQLQREIFENELHAMTTEELYNALKEYDALQDKYHTALILPRESKREVTTGGRDGSAYILRCMKMFYDLPSDVVFSAMSLVDRFLARMAVKPKHMACLTIASFYLTIKQLGLKSISPEELVTISQCGCTAGDLERMARVIDNKLGMQMGYAPVTSVNFLRIYYCLFRNLAREVHPEFFNFYANTVRLEDMENRLENLMCDVRTSIVRPGTMALVVFCLHIDKVIKESYPKGRPELNDIFNYIMVVQQFMKISDQTFTHGFSVIAGLLQHYNGQSKQPYKQRLTWRLSYRTLRNLRPTKRFSSALSTIEETNFTHIEDSCRSRSVAMIPKMPEKQDLFNRTESISSEEEEDWPTSPIIPIFEQC